MIKGTMMSDTPELTPEQLADMSDEDFARYIADLSNALHEILAHEIHILMQECEDKRAQQNTRHRNRLEDMAIQIQRMTDDRMSVIASRKAVHDE